MGALGARGGAGRDRGAPPARRPLLVDHRRAARACAGRDPLRRPGGRQPARPPRALAAAGRAAAAGCRAAAGAVERGRAGRGAAPAAPTRSSSPCRWRGAGRRRARRDIAAITYGANPEKKGLDRVLAAWAAARRAGEELVVAGLRRRAGRARGSRGRAGVRFTGMLPRAEYRALLRRARVFVCAPGARTTGSPSSRRWPTVARSSPRRPRALTRRCRSRGRSTRASSPATSPARSASPSTTRRRATPSGRRTRSPRGGPKPSTA